MKYAVPHRPLALSKLHLISKLHSILTLSIITASLFSTTTGFATDPHYTPPSENIKNFFKGTWEGTLQLGYAIPQSSTELDGAMDWAIGIYHDLGSRMATELQYFSSTDFNSTSPIGTSASFKSSAFIASLRGYGQPGPLDLKYFGRIGIAFYSVDFDNGTTVDSNYDSGNSFVLGFGAEKQTHDKTTFSVEFTYFHDLVQSGYVNSINIGVRQALGTWQPSNL